MQARFDAFKAAPAAYAAMRGLEIPSHVSGKVATGFIYWAMLVMAVTIMVVTMGVVIVVAVLVVDVAGLAARPGSGRSAGDLPLRSGMGIRGRHPQPARVQSLVPRRGSHAGRD